MANNLRGYFFAAHCTWTEEQPYHDRLKVLGLHLPKRCLRGDLIEMYKILTGKENLSTTHSSSPWHLLITIPEDSQTLYMSRSSL